MVPFFLRGLFPPSPRGPFLRMVWRLIEPMAFETIIPVPFRPEFSPGHLPFAPFPVSSPASSLLLLSAPRQMAFFGYQEKLPVGVSNF